MINTLWVGLRIAEGWIWDFVFSIPSKITQIVQDDAGNPFRPQIRLGMKSGFFPVMPFAPCIYHGHAHNGGSRSPDTHLDCYSLIFSLQMNK